MRPNANLIKTTLTGALGGLLFGFDTVVIAGAIDALVNLYGLSPQNKGLTVAIGLVGTVIGALGAGVVGQKLGGRETLRITAVLYVVSALGCGLAWSWPSFLLFRFVGGLGIGASSVLGPVYIAELSPAAWRGRLVGVFQFNVVFGILVAYISNYMIHLLHLGAAEWRWQVGIAAAPAIVFLALLFGIPRSPRWSAARNRIDEALAVLKLMGEPDPQAELDDIRAALAEENASAHEPVLRWKYRYPLFLAISIGAFNQLAGINAILYYLNSIFADRRLQQIVELPAGHRDWGDQPFVHHRRHVADRQAGPQDASAGWRGRLLQLSRRRRVGVRHAVASRRAALAARHVHRFLQRLAGSGHLGLHRRDFSHLGTRQGPGGGQRQPLVHERPHRADVSRGGEQDEHGHAVHILRRGHSGAVDCSRVVLPRDQGADTGAVAAQADADVDRTSHRRHDHAEFKTWRSL